MRQAVFKVTGLTKIYTMGEVRVDALRGIDLELYEQELVVMLGPSGSGKSTLLNIMGGLDTATGGHVSYLERWGGDAPLAGKVRTVEPAAFTKISSLGVEEQRVIVVADITSIPETWQRLGDGFRVEASFILWEGKDVLQVPANALFRHDNGWAVFAFQNNRAYIRKVEASHRNGLSAEILSGIAQGEPVGLGYRF